MKNSQVSNMRKSPKKVRVEQYFGRDQIPRSSDIKGVAGQFVLTKKHRKREEVIMATHWLNTENKLYLTEVKSYTRDG